MKRLIITIIVVLIASQAFAVECFLRNESGNLNPLMKRLQNQYGFIFENDYSVLNEAETRAAHQGAWPKGAGYYFTQLEVDEENGTVWFNVDVPLDVAEAMPRNNNPHFSAICPSIDGTWDYTDPDNPVYTPAPLPTYKKKRFIDDGNGGSVWDGTYYDQTVCIQQ
jgi:hypothetical protein